MDKFGVKVSKRKKRLTRRKLDEIRKRTFKTNGNDEIICYKQAKPTVTNYLTSSRLTLVKKAVRSETMTRSLLSKLQQEENSKEKVPNISSKLESELSHKHTKLNNYSDIEENKTLESITLFNGSDCEKITDMTEVLSASSSSSPSTFLLQKDKSLYGEVMSDIAPPSSSPVTFLLQKNKNLYDEVISDIENYISKTTSVFLKNENMSSYKDIFKAKWVEDEPTFKNKDSVKVQFHTNEYHNLSLIDSDEDITQNPNKCSLENVIPCNISHRTPTSCESIRSSSSAFCSQDSTEYFYYPHKLYQ